MGNSKNIRVMFLDIGGVLLTNGWDHHMRMKAAKAFGLDYSEMNERHHLTFDTYEEGKLSLREYLQRVIFFEQRPFSLQEFQNFMFAQSEPYFEMVDLVRRLKSRYSLRLATISNEGRELTEYRIRKFELDSYIDFFISSCFIHFRKPDEDIYRIALDIAQVKAENSLYLEDRPMFVDIANALGIHAILHTNVDSTRTALEDMGFLL